MSQMADTWIDAEVDVVANHMDELASESEWREGIDLRYEIAYRMVDDLCALSKDINAEEWDQAYARDSLKELDAHICHLTKVDAEAEAEKTDHIYQLIKEERHYENR